MASSLESAVVSWRHHGYLLIYLDFLSLGMPVAFYYPHMPTENIIIVF